MHIRHSDNCTLGYQCFSVLCQNPEIQRKNRMRLVISITPSPLSLFGGLALQWSKSSRPNTSICEENGQDLTCLIQRLFTSLWICSLVLLFLLLSICSFSVKRTILVLTSPTHPPTLQGCWCVGGI